MTFKSIRSAVLAKMRADGIEIDADWNMSKMRIAVENATRHYQHTYESQSEYLARYLRGFNGGTKVEPYQRTWRPISPEDVKPHWRADDIDAGQPPFMTPKGAVGNGSENSPVWRR